MTAININDKLYHWRYGEVTVSEIYLSQFDGKIMVVSVDDPEGVINPPETPTPVEKTKKFLLSDLNKCIHTEAIGAVKNEGIKPINLERFHTGLSERIINDRNELETYQGDYTQFKAEKNKLVAKLDALMAELDALKAEMNEATAELDRLPAEEEKIKASEVDYETHELYAQALEQIEIKRKELNSAIQQTLALITEKENQINSQNEKIQELVNEFESGEKDAKAKEVLQKIQLFETKPYKEFFEFFLG